MGTLEFTSEQLDLMRVELEALRKENERLVALAYRDPLTGLRNRRCFSERLTEELCRNHRRHTPLSIICLDLNGFKHLNDTKGHQAGDEALIGVGNFLEAMTRAEDLCCRLGGDEFAILLTDTDAVQCCVVVNRIRARLVDLIKLGLNQGLSIGSATLQEGDDEVSLFARADEAMYADKRSHQKRRTPAGTSGRIANAA